MIQSAQKNRTRLLIIVTIAVLLAAIWAVSSSAAALPPSPGTLGMVVDDINDSIIVFDTSTDTVLGSVRIGPRTNGDCSITADQTLGFATDLNSRIWVIDLTTGTPGLATGTNPIPISNAGEDTSITPDQKFLVVSDGSRAQPISVVDIASRLEVSTFTLGSDHNSVEVLSDGSVLVTSNFRGTVHRLTIDGAGNLTDTGDVLFSGGSGFSNGPNNVFGAPGATSGIVVRRAPREIRSFAIPGLALVDVRSLTGGFGISGLVHPAGNLVYVRSNGSPGTIDVFSYNSATGTLSLTPLFSIPIKNTPAFFGMDQMAITPDGSKLYVSQPSSVNVYDANTGALLTTITDLSISRPTGVCIAPHEPIEMDKVLLVIDEDGIDNGNPPNFFSDVDVNAHIADIGVRSQLPYFAARVGDTVTLTLHAGEVGDEGWFALKTIPSSWVDAGPSVDGLRNYLDAGPGLGTPDVNGDREALLDKVPGVIPLRATGLKMLEGQQVCALVYDGDISININYDAANGIIDGSLKGANLGTVAFEVISATQLTGYSSSSLPKVVIQILDADEVCERELVLFTDAPEPLSSSEPFDVVP